MLRQNPVDREARIAVARSEEHDVVPAILQSGGEMPAVRFHPARERLGDPLAANVGAYRNDGSDAASTFAWRAGDHHDAMFYFGMGADNRWSPASAVRALRPL